MAETWENNQKHHASSHSEGRSVGDGNRLPTEKIKNLLAQFRRGLKTTADVVVWTPEEQRIVEEGIIKFASLPSVIKYAKIASQLSKKTMYDVAFRCRWMAKRVSDSTPLKHVADMEDCAGIFAEAIDGEEGDLLLSTSLALRQISENLASFKIHENLDLIDKARDNILKMMNNLWEKDGLMKDAPPFGLDIDEERVNTVVSFPLSKDLPLATAIIDKAAEILRRKALASHQISENIEGSQIDENLEMSANAGDNILNMTNNLVEEDRLVNVEITEELLNYMLPCPPPKEPSFHPFF